MLMRDEQHSPAKGIRRFRNPRDGLWHVQLSLGDTYVTSRPDEVLTTILGSCIAACIRDPQLGIGGMNHFLLPHGEGQDRAARCYGVNAMELLINDIIKQGGNRCNLQAKLFGGANVIAALSHVGTRNAAFAQQFLEDEGIAVVGGDVGGRSARRIEFCPVSGRARQAAVTDTALRQVEQEIDAVNAGVEAADSSSVEFFDD